MHLHLEVTVTLLELADDEALSEVVLQISHCFGAQTAFHRTGLLAKGLLEAERQLLELLVSLVQFLLDLLDLGLEPDVLVPRDVVRYLQVPVVVLEVLLLHLHEIVERLGLRVRLRAENHFAHLFALELVQLLRVSCTRSVRQDLRYEVPAHSHLRLDVSHRLSSGHAAPDLLVACSTRVVELI